jgi:hypothetical protein
MVILFDIHGTLIDHNQAEAIAVAALHQSWASLNTEVRSSPTGEPHSSVITVDS